MLSEGIENFTVLLGFWDEIAWKTLQFALHFTYVEDCE